MEHNCAIPRKEAFHQILYDPFGIILTMLKFDRTLLSFMFYIIFLFIEKKIIYNTLEILLGYYKYVCATYQPTKTLGQIFDTLTKIKN